MPRTWSGEAQSGSRDYDDDDVQRVLDALPRGRDAAMTLRTFAETLSMEPRKVRAILSDHDGKDFLLAYDDAGLMWDAERFEDATAHTEKLRARALTEMARVARRERYARARLPRRQGVMAEVLA